MNLSRHSLSIPILPLLSAALLAIFLLPGCFKTPEGHARLAKDKSASVEKRLKSVRALNDQALLADVVVNANDRKGGDIQSAALEKLTDQKTLEAIIKNYDLRSDIRKEAVTRITDQKMLEAIAKNYLLMNIREEAVARMTDEKQLAHLARTIGSSLRPSRNDRNIARAAVEKLTDQTLLAAVAREVDTHVIPVEAFSKLADQAVLSILALHAKDKDMRVFAVEKLTDQTYLALIAEDVAGGDLSQEKDIIVSSPEYIRMLAVKKLDSQHALVGVAMKKNEHLHVRKAAIYRLTDQALVAGVAEKFKVSDTPAEFAERGRAEIIAEFVEKHLAGFAERHLAELRLLARINGNDSGAAVNASDMKRLGDGQLLADIALSTFDRGVRTAAVKQLTDQRLLADIAGNISASGDIRLLAAERLTDQQLLADIAKDEKSHDTIAGEAWRRWMNERPLFTWWPTDEEYLAIRRESDAVRAFAAGRLTDHQLPADAAKNARASDVLELIEGKLDDDDQKRLAAIAGNAADDRGAWIALNKLNMLAPDSEMLAGLARAARADARLWAVWRMEDRSLLDELSRNDPDARVRKAASLKASSNPQLPTNVHIMTVLEEGKILAEFRSLFYGLSVEVNRIDLKNYLVSTIKNLTPWWDLQIIIPAGSHFVYENPWYDKEEYRSVVSTVDVTVGTLPTTYPKWIPVVFANRAKRISQTDVPGSMRKGSLASDIARTSRAMKNPYGSASFALRRHPNEDALKKLMTHPDWRTLAHGGNRPDSSSIPDLCVVQAAVLIVTDDVMHDELASAFAPYFSITEDDMARAMRLCAEAGIDIKQKRIWDDCAKILAGLEAGELKNWLEKFSGLAVPAHGLIQSQALQHPAAVQHQSPI